ncbi:MAG TPA: TonB-dependent receptor, partial [Bacteroidales bacterium]
YIGNPFPKWIGGCTNTLSYKNIDFAVFTYFSFGNKVLNLLRVRTDDPRGTTNLRTVAKKYVKLGYIDGNSSNTNIWNIYTLPGADDSEVRMGARDNNQNYALSTRYVEDGSFFRIQNISVGYTLPVKLVSKLHISKLRVYSNIQNVATFGFYTGYDPEVGSTQGSYSLSGQNMLMYGVDAGRIPTPRVYTVGLDLTF